jgi:hypothetical protein
MGFRHVIVEIIPVDPFCIYFKIKDKIYGN